MASVAYSCSPRHLWRIRAPRPLQVRSSHSLHGCPLPMSSAPACVCFWSLLDDPYVSREACLPPSCASLVILRWLSEAPSASEATLNAMKPTKTTKPTKTPTMKTPTMKTPTTKTTTRVLSEAWLRFETRERDTTLIGRRSHSEIIYIIKQLHDQARMTWHASA